MSQNTMDQVKSSPVVMTLDAGGTNFVFSAIQAENEIVEPMVLPSNGNDLDKCLRNIIKGFEMVREKLTQQPVAISFAFPGPADYASGIIGDLGNLPGFRGGVALGPMLEDHFKIPVFINNDGDLFAYGEAIHGLLPHINQKLKDAGSHKQYQNLFGLTLGTGFGGGMVRNNELFLGDNGAATEVWLLRNPFNHTTFAEESISARAITVMYAQLMDMQADLITPYDVYQIALGKLEGKSDLALEAFRKFGKALGMAIADISTIVDGLVVIGGGLASAKDLFFPAMMEELNGQFNTADGSAISRLVLKVYDLQNQNDFVEFASGDSVSINVPFSSRSVNYDPQKRIGIGISTLGASKAISLGAYAFALNALSKK